jgi:predicted Zn-dependent protease
MTAPVSQSAPTDLADDLLSLFEEPSLQASRSSADPAALEALYGLAWSSLNHRRFDESRRLFSLLISLDPRQPRFLAGLGHSATGLDDHAQALAFHSLALKAEPANIALMLPVARAYLALGQRELATDVLALVQECCRLDPSQASVAEPAEVLLELIRNGR